MVIVFYDTEQDCLYVSSEREKMHKIKLDDNPLSSIPNDDILYVQKGCYVTKQQLGQWLDGSMDLNGGKEEYSQYTGIRDANSPAGEPDEVSNSPPKYYIHAAHNGTVLIEDIQTPQFPDGIVLNGKWHFIAVDKIGADVLEASQFYKTLVNKKKIEVVSHEYVKKNMHKQNTAVSPHERALDAILIKDDRRGAALRVASTGGINSNRDGVIEIEVEGEG